MNGVIVIDKPQEFTSFDVVAVARKVLHTKKIGHCGTLDPNATGVLPILIGNATKAQDIIPNHDKSYVATFELGLTSDTLDKWGEVAKVDGIKVSKEEINKALKNFVGEIMQVPPMYSAIQKDGVRLYELARKGIEVQREARKITIYSLTLDEFDEQNQSGTLSISCSRGTYIRQLIADIAKSLGTSAIMTSLVRTSACGFTLSQSMTLEKLKALAESNAIESQLMSVESLFYDYDEIIVSDKQAHRFRNGNPLDIERTVLRDTDCENGRIFRVKSNMGEFLALGIVDKDKCVLKIYKHFGN